MYAMTSIGARILEEEGDDTGALRRFAGLLDAGWKLKRNLSKSVTSSAIDDLYSRGKELGAWGGKLLGAGGGGFVLFLLPLELRPLFIENFGQSQVLPVAMATEGSTVKTVF
jgi:D-glycero-alpha-D-manno-heptose-7-phosphate kinase